jgi:hypothetical protein
VFLIKDEEDPSMKPVYRISECIANYVVDRSVSYLCPLVLKLSVGQSVRWLTNFSSDPKKTFQLISLDTFDETHGMALSPTGYEYNEQCRRTCRYLSVELVLPSELIKGRNPPDLRLETIERYDRTEKKKCPFLTFNARAGPDQRFPFESTVRATGWFNDIVSGSIESIKLLPRSVVKATRLKYIHSQLVELWERFDTHEEGYAEVHRALEKWYGFAREMSPKELLVKFTLTNSWLTPSLFEMKYREVSARYRRDIINRILLPDPLIELREDLLDFLSTHREARAFAYNYNPDRKEDKTKKEKDPPWNSAAGSGKPPPPPSLWNSFSNTLSKNYFSL